MNLKTKLYSALEESFVKLGFDTNDITLTFSNRPDDADYQCNSVFAIAKKTHQNPEVVANAIIENLNQDVAEVTFARPGFINFSLSEAYTVEILNKMNEDVYNKFSNYKGTVDKYCSVVYEKLINNEEVSLKDKQMLMNFLYSNVGTNDPTIYNMQENMIKRLMNGEEKCDYHDAKFLVDFIAKEESKEYGFDVEDRNKVRSFSR